MTTPYSPELFLPGLVGDASESPDKGGEYVLMSAAHNEEANIERTIEGILGQSIVPKRWVIVSDNSSDRTDEIIQKYSSRFDFIRFLKITRQPGRSFASKVVALQHAAPLLDEVSYRFIGNIDSDISVGPDYFESLLNRFRNNTRLGIAAGFVYENTHGNFRSRRTNSIHSVAHAAQLVRRECYEAIGGYAVLEHGGEDWHAQVSANMRGWDIEAFPDLRILHYRRTGSHGNLLRNAIREGRADYSFGSYPLFEVLKCLLRLGDKPLVVGAMFRLGGFFDCYLRGEKRAVSEEVAEFLRNQQKSRVLSAFRRAGIHRSRHNSLHEVRKPE